jgi:thymidine kinase
MSRRGIKVISGDTVDPGALADYDVIGIDEVQFFGNVVDPCTQLAASGKIIIACGLDADHARRPFGCVPQLIAVAEDVVKLAAVCKCGADAAFTLRTVEATEIVLIGGKDKYRPVCRKCYEQRHGVNIVAESNRIHETKKELDVNTSSNN